MTTERKRALEALLGFEQPLEQVKGVLSTLPWDAHVELVTLSIRHVAKVLDQFLAGRATPEQVESWANAIEGRDDIGLEATNEAPLREFIHELANPLLTQPLTRQSASELLKRIDMLLGKTPLVIQQRDKPRG